MHFYNNSLYIVNVETTKWPCLKWSCSNSEESCSIKISCMIILVIYMFSTSAHTAKFTRQQLACKTVEKVTAACLTWCSWGPVLWSERGIWPDFSLDLFSLGLEYILNNLMEVFWKMQEMSICLKIEMVFALRLRVWSKIHLDWTHSMWEMRHGGNWTFDNKNSNQSRLHYITA